MLTLLKLTVPLPVLLPAGLLTGKTIPDLDLCQLSACRPFLFSQIFILIGEKPFLSDFEVSSFH